MKRGDLIGAVCGILVAIWFIGEKESYFKVDHFVSKDKVFREDKVEHPTDLLIVHTDDPIKYDEQDEFCLAKNIYHEARNEEILGQMAVAQVTLNRVTSGKYPDTVCGVVMQHKQFSWANDHSIRWTTPKSRAWETSKALAVQFLERGVRVAGLQTALFYHADYVSPRWRDNDQLIAQIGAHIFYEGAL